MKEERMKEGRGCFGGCCNNPTRGDGDSELGVGGRVSGQGTKGLGTVGDGRRRRVHYDFKIFDLSDEKIEFSSAETK